MKRTISQCKITEAEIAEPTSMNFVLASQCTSFEFLLRNKMIGRVDEESFQSFHSELEALSKDLYSIISISDRHVNNAQLILS